MSNLLGCPFPPNPRVAGLMPYACSTARSSYPNETYDNLKKLSGGKKSRRAGKKTRKGGRKSRRGGNHCTMGGKKSRKGGRKSRRGGRKSRRGGYKCGSMTGGLSCGMKGGGHCHKKHRKKHQSKKR